jgi:hypothetical protein
MIKVDLLLVGDALDGPVDEITRVDSLDKFLRMFGGYYYEETAISSGTTGYTLSNTPWADSVLPLQYDSDGSLIAKRLFELSVNGTSLTFTRSGSPSSTVVFRYPVIPGTTSLVRGMLQAAKTATNVHVLRLGGVHANTASSGGFVFSAKFPGSRYNGTQIVVTGSTVSITPAAGTGRLKSYTITTDDGFISTLRNEVARGFQSIVLTGPGSQSTKTLPNGTYILTGGTDGTLTADALVSYIEENDVSGIDVICPVGISTTELSGSDLFSLLDTTDYPNLLVAQAPSSGVALSGSVNTLRNLCSVAFDLTLDLGDPRQRTEGAAPLVAAIIAGTRFGITLAPLLEGPVSPVYDQSGLTALSDAGHTAAYKSISKDWAIYHANTGDENWRVSTFRSFQEIVRPVYETLEPLLGNVVLNLSSLNDILGDAFSSVVGSRVLSWNLNQSGDTLYCEIEFRPYGEVRTVKARMSLGVTESADLA